jgi:hypothetical protein
MKFFVARVNLTEQARLGFSYLRPLQMAFESPKFMLPIRLGTLNADGHQDLFVYALTRNGRVETTNYRTVRLPTGMELPVYVKDSAVLPRDVRAPGAARGHASRVSRVCVGHELVRSVRRRAAVDRRAPEAGRVLARPASAEPAIRSAPRGNPRRRVRHAAPRAVRRRAFPRRPRVPGNRGPANFQGRYVLRHPWKGEARCDAAERYRESLRARVDTEAATLASLTGWPLDEIRRKIGPVSAVDQRRWWEKLYAE